MKLGITDRIHLPELLPSKGSYIEMLLREDILKKVLLTQVEMEKWEVKIQTNESGQTSFGWNKEKVEDVDIEFSDAENELIKKQLKEMDDKKELTPVFVILYKKFNG